MSKTLEERLCDAKLTLEEAEAAITQKTEALQTEVRHLFIKAINFRGDIDHWINLVRSRSAAQQLLDGLEKKTDKDDYFYLDEELKLPFEQIRFIGTQGYVTTAWSLADSISGFVGRILCTPECGFNEAKPAQIIPHFVHKDSRKKNTAALVYESVRQTFGWPLGISYAIRNHFVHNGGQVMGSNFFRGPTSASAFQISNDGWDSVENVVNNEYKVERSCIRSNVKWPDTPKDDLRITLNVCQYEMDEALGILLGSACAALRFHIAFMLGED